MLPRPATPSDPQIGPEAHEREQVAVCFRAAVEDIFDEYGNISAHGHAEEGHAEGEHDQRFHGSLAANELDAFLEAGEHRFCGFLGQEAGVIRESEMMGARNERAFRPKHHFSPSFASACPASAGPTMTATLNWIEFSAMAFGISSFSTRVGINAW